MRHSKENGRWDWELTTIFRFRVEGMREFPPMSPTPGDSRSGLPIPLIRQGSTISHMQQRVNNSPGGQVLNYSHNKHLREGTPQGLSREASPGSSLGSLLTLVPTGNSGHVSMKPGLSNSLQAPPGDREQGVLPAVVGSVHHEALQQQQQALHQQAYHQQVWSIVPYPTPAVVTGPTCFHLTVHRHRPCLDGLPSNDIWDNFFCKFGSIITIL